jgi:hypothetical protein
MTVQSMEMDDNCLRMISIFQLIIVYLIALEGELSMGWVLFHINQRRRGWVLPCCEDTFIVLLPLAFG